MSETNPYVQGGQLTPAGREAGLTEADVRDGKLRTDGDLIARLEAHEARAAEGARSSEKPVPQSSKTAKRKAGQPIKTGILGKEAGEGADMSGAEGPPPAPPEPKKQPSPEPNSPKSEARADAPSHSKPK